MRRRDFLGVLSGVAATWPLAARTQERRTYRRIGVLVPNPEDPGGNARVVVFRQALDLLGWTVGRNLQIDVRWAGAMPISFVGSRSRAFGFGDGVERTGLPARNTTTLDPRQQSSVAVPRAASPAKPTWSVDAAQRCESRQI